MTNPFLNSAKKQFAQDQGLTRGHDLLKRSNVQVGDRITAVWKESDEGYVEMQSVMGVVLDIGAQDLLIKPRHGDNLSVPIERLHPNRQGLITIQRKISQEELAMHDEILKEIEEEAELDQPIFDGFEETASEVQEREADVEAYQRKHQEELEKNPFFNSVDPFEGR